MMLAMPSAEPSSESIEPSASAPRIDTSNDGLIVGHAVLAGLCELIPIPFLDDMVKRRVMRRMVRALADAHGLRVWESEVRDLVDPEGGGLLGKMAKAVVLRPIKKILRKVFFVLSGKKMVDVASETYHRGWLLDHAFAQQWCAPTGLHPARTVRRAIDEVLLQTPVTKSPVTSALKKGFEHSQEGLARVWARLRDSITDADDSVVDDAVNAADEETATVVESLLDALGDVPSEHFDELARKLATKLQ